MKKTLKRHSKYLISVENVSRLERVASVRVSPLAMAAAAVVGVLLAIAAGGALVMVSPLKRVLPGYMKADERTATQEGLLRLDSLRQVSMRRDAWLAGVMRALDTSRPVPELPAPDSLATATPFSPDSLMPGSERERRFVSAMHEREKYNLSVLAPLAAERMEFMAPVPGGVFVSGSEEALRAEIAAPSGSPAVAVADGTVITAYISSGPEGGVTVIQHDNGFVTRYSGLELPAVSAGDRIEAGRAIAYRAARRKDGTRMVFLEMWHDSDPVVPYRYVAGDDTPDGLPG
ncbi:MAG: M23 family metallopeptidase [Muribaculaceae bacterium]|nr:M23 family metallopeptidase [Muribaculaceae bacterium]